MLSADGLPGSWVSNAAFGQSVQELELQPEARGEYLQLLLSVFT